jgi:hypothetical protein
VTYYAAAQDIEKSNQSLEDQNRSEVKVVDPKSEFITGFKPKEGDEKKFYYNQSSALL